MSTGVSSLHDSDIMNGFYVFGEVLQVIILVYIVDYGVLC